MSDYGYSHGQAFGDPDQYTRGTGEDEIDRFNQWMRGQPWWAAAQHNPSMVQQHLAQMGIHLPDSFHIDEAGNVNQKSRAGKIAKIAAIGGGAAAMAFGIPGLFPGLIGGAAGIPALEGGGTLAANLGGAGALGSLGAGAAIPALEGGATLAANLGGAGARGAGGGAGLGTAAGAAGAGAAGGEWQGPPLSGMGAAEGGGSRLLQDALRLAPVGAGLIQHLAAGGGNDGGQNGQMSPELQQMLQMSLQRMQQQQPLFDAVSKQALAGLPTYAKGGQ